MKFYHKYPPHLLFPLVFAFLSYVTFFQVCFEPFAQNSSITRLISPCWPEIWKRTEAFSIGRQVEIYKPWNCRNHYLWSFGLGHADLSYTREGRHSMASHVHRRPISGCPMPTFHIQGKRGIQWRAKCISRRSKTGYAIPTCNMEESWGVLHVKLGAYMEDRNYCTHIGLARDSNQDGLVERLVDRPWIWTKICAMV